MNQFMFKMAKYELVIEVFRCCIFELKPTKTTDFTRDELRTSHTRYVKNFKNYYYFNITLFLLLSLKQNWTDSHNLIYINNKYKRLMYQKVTTLTVIFDIIVIISCVYFYKRKNGKIVTELKCDLQERRSQAYKVCHARHIKC